MTKSFDAQGLQFAWDATSIKLAETCLRKYQLSMLEGWKPKGKGVHLRFGGHYATALEHFYKHKALGASHEEALRLVVREALEDTWDRLVCETCKGAGTVDERHGGETTSSANTPCPDCEDGFTGTGAPWNSDHNTKTRENLIRTIIWYTEQFRDDNAQVVILSSGKPAVEHSFTLPVDNGIVFAGHLDRLVEYEGNKMVMDQKTTGATISPYYFEQFSPDTQMSMYTFAGKAIFDIPVKGVIIDAAQIAVGFSRFARQPTFRTDEQLHEWYDSAMYFIEQARIATMASFFPMNTASCGNYGGCEFRHICARNPSARNAFLKGDFEKGTRWDPLERR